MAKRMMLRFNDRPYTRSHWHAPRGHGMWAFTTDQTAETFWSPSMTYSDAKRWIATKMREMRPADAVTINVLP